MRDLVTRVADSTRARRLLPQGARILVAVSGGVDSMVLLEILHRLAPSYRWTLAVAHFNHHLRGRSSDADERLVRATAKRLGWRCFAGGAKVRNTARRRGLSVEMAARELRHRFLARAARRFGAVTIALAHHADDQVEHFFLRLLRGTGAHGLRGMRWKSPSPFDAAIQLTRPLLDLTKEELDQFARTEKIPFREDVTNRSLAFLRNRIRGKLLPLLAQDYQPALSDVIRRQMEILGAESDVLDEMASRWLAAAKPRPFDRLPIALQRRVLQAQLPPLGVDPGFLLIEKLREAPRVPVAVSPALRLARDDSGRIRPVTGGALSFSARETTVTLCTRRQHGQFDGLNWSARLLPRQKPAPAFGQGREFFDADRVGRTILLRHWRKGDRFQPSGMPAPVKLQDLFTNLKVPPAERRRRVVATTTDGQIWWVEGLRIAERFKIFDGTRRLLHWEWRRP